MAKRYSRNSVRAMDKAEIEALCEQVLAMGKLGYTLRVMCLETDHSVAEFNDLREHSPMFEEALSTALDWSLGAAERTVLENLNSKSLNTQALGQILKANHPALYEQATYRVKQEEKTDAQEVKPHSYYTEQIDQLLKDLRAVD